MKKKLILINILLIFVFNIFFSTSVNAAVAAGSGGGMGAGLQTDITSETFLDKFDPNKANSKAAEPATKTITTVVNKVLGIIQIIGGILTVVAVAMFGFNRVLATNEHFSSELGIKGGGPGGAGSPETKFVLLAYGRSMVIGGILLFSSTTIVRFIFNLFY